VGGLNNAMNLEKENP